MKIRNGFVSNSSSSSFCINKDNLTPLQILLIKNHCKFVIENWQGITDIIEKYELPRLYKPEITYAWNIEENEEEISGNTYMDNFDMDAFLNLIGVKDVEFKEY